MRKSARPPRTKVLSVRVTEEEAQTLCALTGEGSSAVLRPLLDLLLAGEIQITTKLTLSIRSDSSVIRCQESLEHNTTLAPDNRAPAPSGKAHGESHQKSNEKGNDNPLRSLDLANAW